jgi:hypothetical protein
MKTKYMLFVLPLVALCACNKEGLGTQENDGPVSISVSNGENTKTVIRPDGENYNISWSGNEAIKVIYVNPTVSGDPAEDYTFNYEYEEAGVATFTTTSFKTGGFKKDDEFLVGYSGDFRVSVRTDAVGGYYGWMTIPHQQEYNASNPIGLKDDFFPMWGYIKVGDASYPVKNIQMSTGASIIKLVLKNGTGSAQTINNITLTTNVPESRRGVAGAMIIEGVPGVSTPQLRYDDLSPYYSPNGALFAGTVKKTITLQCGNVKMANNEEKVFSFVVCGRIVLQDLTWKVWADAESTSQIGSDITSAECPGLGWGKVYTKRATL